jgi:hypothetical protein
LYPILFRQKTEIVTCEATSTHYAPSVQVGLAGNGTYPFEHPTRNKEHPTPKAIEYPISNKEYPTPNNNIPPK